MSMKPALYDEVHQLSVDIVNASFEEDSQNEWGAYNRLRELCILNENTAQDHPLQWEALADFTTNTQQALLLYKKALKCSELLGLDQYSASIKLEVAKKHLDENDVESALSFAYQANELAETTNNLELRKEISEFLLNTNKDT